MKMPLGAERICKRQIFPQCQGHERKQGKRHISEEILLGIGRQINGYSEMYRAGSSPFGSLVKTRTPGLDFNPPEP